MQAGYKLDGTGLSSYVTSAFIGPATAGAMVDAQCQSFLNNYWTFESSFRETGYYGPELRLLPMIVASGSWWSP